MVRPAKLRFETLTFSLQALPFLHNTVLFLYPIGLVALFYLFSLLLNFNMSIFIMNYYFG